jgi:hypothetical protein
MSATNEHSAVFITRLKVNSRLLSRYLKSEVFAIFADQS